MHEINFMKYFFIYPVHILVVGNMKCSTICKGQANFNHIIRMPLLPLMFPLVVVLISITSALLTIWKYRQIKGITVIYERTQT